MFHMIGACKGTLNSESQVVHQIDFKTEKKLEETFYLFNAILKDIIAYWRTTWLSKFNQSTKSLWLESDVQIALKNQYEDAATDRS